MSDNNQAERLAAMLAASLDHNEDGTVTLRFHDTGNASPTGQTPKIVRRAASADDLTHGVEGIDLAHEAAGTDAATDTSSEATVVSPSKQTTTAKSEGSQTNETVAVQPAEPAYAVRGDRLNLQVNNANAQALFSPDACVFIANLASGMSDEDLEYGVIAAFQQFGEVYVKIRRDNRQMPFAFAQYKNTQDAKHAIAQGRGVMIYGRPCRTEIAKVGRALYMSKILGGPVTEQEAADQLGRFGAIESMWIPSQTDREVHGLPEGIYVRFHYFEDFRDAHAAFRDHPVYRLEQPRATGRAVPVAPRNRDVVAENPRGHRWLGNEAATVYVGDFPRHFTADDLRRLFAGVGGVVNVMLLYKTLIANGIVIPFAFVEFATEHQAHQAVLIGAGLMRGIRVEMKQDHRNQARRFFSGRQPHHHAGAGNMAVVPYHGYQLGPGQQPAAPVAQYAALPMQWNNGQGYGPMYAQPNMTVPPQNDNAGTQQNIPAVAVAGHAYEWAPPQNGNGPQYGHGYQYGNGAQYGEGPQYGNGQQYGNDGSA